MSKSDDQRKPTIGLVGGIGSGKSRIAEMFASLGCAVINADDLAKVQLQNPQVAGQLAQWWGPEVLASDGTVNRQAVAQRVFSDMDQLRRLEDLIHPRVLSERERLWREYQRNPQVVAIVDDTPLLMEKHLDQECDVLVFVDTSLEERRRRVRESRGWDAAELERRQQTQWPLDIKAQRADYSIDNNADPLRSLEQVRTVLHQILQKRF